MLYMVVLKHFLSLKLVYWILPLLYVPTHYYIVFSSELSLDQQIECLSRAVMCAKCCNLATTASSEGEFLHQLEEHLEVG